MEELIDFQSQLLQNLSRKERYLIKVVDWSDRMIAIKGTRGSGKTTLLLQKLRELSSDVNVLYATLDHLYFLENNLLTLAKTFVLNGGTHLFLDEVHKYPNWSRELKLIYDQFPKLKVVFTSSSLLELFKGESDLSRRVVAYTLKELSFREYLWFELDKKLPTYSLKDILKHHTEIARNIVEEIEIPIKYFKDYLKYGSYPFYLESINSYQHKLENTLSLTLEVDLNAIEGVSYEDSRKLKKLLVAIAQSAPFTPNISKLSSRLKLQRAFLIKALRLMNRADLVIELFKPTKGIGAFTKPEKLYLNNSNLIYVLAQNKVEIGTIRETFFANQLKYLHHVHLSDKADFFIDNTYTFEIGGKHKTTHQIQNIKNSFIVKDNMEIGSLNVIPLYLFGFLY